MQTQFEPAPGFESKAEFESALPRSFIYRFLAQIFDYPNGESWAWLTDRQTATAMDEAARALGIEAAAQPMLEQLAGGSFQEFLEAHLAAFGHAARGTVPVNEIDYGDLKADPLFQPHRLADLAAFYCAFGLELASGASERQDHVCLELEFMSVLAAKEMYATGNQAGPDALTVCRAAEKEFLREHLGRWAPAFTRRVEKSVNDSVLIQAARFTRSFIETECARFGVNPGSEDLVLRPIDEEADSLCASCGLRNLPPGAMNPT